MKGQYKRFCSLYKEHLEGKSVGSKFSADFVTYQATRYTFSVAVNKAESSSGQSISRMFKSDIELTIDLDDEDLEYLYKKYSAKLREEMLGRIDELKMEYSKFIKDEEDEK